MKKRLIFGIMFVFTVFLSFANQIDFLNCEGEWSVYIDTANDNNIYSWDGDPLAYVDEDLNIYGFNGKYLGWLESQVMYNIDGEPFACIENAYTDYVPYKKNRFSGVDAVLYLSQGC